MSREPNPFVKEGLQVYFSHATILRTYVVLLAVLGALLFFWWPRGPLAASLFPGAAPRTFTAVAMGWLAVLAWLSARYGAEDYSSGSFIPLREYVTLTPVAIGTVVAGKLAFATLHTLFLLALGAPFVLASLAVSAVPMPDAARAFLVVGAAAVACRMLGSFLLVALGERSLVRDLAMLAIACVAVPASLALFPAANPVSAILSLGGAVDSTEAVRLLGATLPFYLFSVIINLLAAIACAAAMSVCLAVARKARHGATG
jgi:hypothetical protein